MALCSLPPLGDCRRKSELSKWISKVKRKKSKCDRSKRKSLFVSALLYSALEKLKFLKKEESRKLKIQPMLVEERQQMNILDPEICELDRSINEFMSKLKEIKTHVRR
ncbi:hypothetical protein WA026_022398 [Henosepilachna vigintioctopunctata]|uniref:Uncharacterized protein n=1 Tax=Henosepilachna vigintioctopunctata TaxID=420089 RepID=A0AAW1U460_9CUCU